MKKYNKSIGSYGEEISVDFLKKEGYSILEKILIAPLVKLI